MRPILLEVPRVVGLLRSGGRQRQQVRSRHVHDASWAEQASEVPQHILWVCDVFDGLQKGDRVARCGFTVVFDHRTSEANR